MSAQNKKRKKLDSEPGARNQSETSRLATELFENLYRKADPRYLALMKQMYSLRIVSKKYLNEMVGCDVDTVEHRHLFEKFINPDYKISQTSNETHELLLNSSSYAIRHLNFFIFHYGQNGFTNRWESIENAQLSELVETLKKSNDHCIRAMVCIAALQVELEGKISLEELGKTIDEIWELYPYEFITRDKAIESMSAEQLIDLNEYQKYVRREIGCGYGLSSWGDFERGWESFTMSLNTTIKKRIDFFAEELGKKSYKDLTDTDRQVLAIAEGSEELFSMQKPGYVFDS